MTIRPLRGDTSPLYQQIAASIRYDIAGQVYYPGEKLPTTRQAAKELGVHYHTVRKAYHVLARAGLICLRPRRRCTISTKVINIGPSVGQRHAFIEQVIKDAEYLFGLHRADLCRRIKRWDYRDNKVPPWPESAGVDGRTNTPVAVAEPHGESTYPESEYGGWD